MSLKLGALLELAEKSVVVGELGKLMVEEIPLDRTEPGHPRAPYNSELALSSRSIPELTFVFRTDFEKTDELMQQAQKCIQDVVFNPVSINEQYGGEQNAGYTPNQYHQRGPSGEEGQQQDFGNGGQHSYGGAYGQDSWRGNDDNYGGGAGQDSYRKPYGEENYDASRVYGEQRQGYLPEIHSASTLTGSSNLPAGARNGDNDSFVDSYRAAEATQALGVPQVDGTAHDNRSSLAYMDGPAPATNAWNESSLPTHQEEDETLARERAQAEESLAREKAEAEETERKEMEKRGQAKQDSMAQPYRYDNLASGGAAAAATTSSSDYQPRETHDAPPADPRAEGLLYSPPPPTHNKYYPEAIERPYIPREGDGAYHGRPTHEPPPPSSAALHPISTTAPPPSAVNTALPLSPQAPPTPTQPMPAANPSPQQPAVQRKPIMIRGESALGSKYGDVFVQGAQGAVTTTPSFSGPTDRGATTPTTSSGYFRGNTGDDNRSTNSGEPRKVNAGAFRRAQPIGASGSLAGGAPQFGNTMSGPSQADAIRDLYRSNSQSEEQQRLQQQPTQSGPRFDVSLSLLFSLACTRLTRSAGLTIAGKQRTSSTRPSWLSSVRSLALVLRAPSLTGSLIRQTSRCLVVRGLLSASSTVLSISQHHGQRERPSARERQLHASTSFAKPDFRGLWSTAVRDEVGLSLRTDDLSPVHVSATIYRFRGVS